MKICRTCKVEKPLSDFHKKKSGRDGLQRQCKKCRNLELSNFQKIKAEKYKSNPVVLIKKTCKTCRKIKPISEFGRSQNFKDLHHPHCKLCTRIYKAQWKKENHPARLKSDQKYRKNNREKIRKSQKSYQKRNILKYRAWAAKRRADLLLRTPSWADLKAIERFYENCPKGYEVDHIVPLKGKKVSGLHVLENLQYLPERENWKKNNFIDLEEHNRKINKLN